MVRPFSLSSKELKDAEEDMSSTMEDASSLTNPLLISRGSGSVEELKRALTNGTSGDNGPNRTKSGSTELYEYDFIYFSMNDCPNYFGDNSIFTFMSFWSF